MGDLQGVGHLVAWQGSQATQNLRAHEVLHRHGFTCTQQAAVEHRVGAHAAVTRVILWAGRRVLETPRLNALLPIREHEGQVRLALERPFSHGFTGRDEQAVLHQTALITRHTEGLLRTCQAIFIGATTPQSRTTAIVDGHLGVCHRLALVQRCDPHRSAIATQLDVHPHVAHQHPRAHVHGRRTRQQTGTQAGRAELDDVVPRIRQRDAHHLERTRIVGMGGRDGQFAGLFHATQQRQLAGANLLLTLVAACAAVPVVFGHPFHPL